MKDLTTAELRKWYNDMLEQCKQLQGKRDSISNAIRICNCEQMSQIQIELTRRNEYVK